MRAAAAALLLGSLAFAPSAAADTPYLGVSAGYEAIAIGPQSWANGLLGTVRIGPQDGSWNLSLLMDYRFPIFVDTLPNGLRVDIVAFRFMIGMRIAKHGPLTLEGALGGGFDLVRTETRPDVGPVNALATPALRASVSERFRVYKHFDIVVSALLEVDPSGTTFQTDAYGQPFTVLSPWPLRPGLMLEVAAP